MRHPPILAPILLCPALVIAGCLALAAPAAAQQAPVRSGQALGLRYLTWPGKVERAGPAPATAIGARGPAASVPLRAAASADAAAAPSAIRPSRYGPSASNGLTPANVWLGGASRTPATPVPVYDAPAAQAPQSATVAPERTSIPPTAVGPAPSADPMAPRRDALIFRMQAEASSQPAPARNEPQAPSPAPPAPAYAAVSGQPARDGARYYSVHRAAGRQPDAPTMPASVYLDHMPIDLTDPPTSADLAEPPATPAVTRTVNGRVQVINPDEDPSPP